MSAKSLPCGCEDAEEHHAGKTTAAQCFWKGRCSSISVLITQRSDIPTPLKSLALIHQTHSADNLHTFASRRGEKHLALKHVNPKSRCWLSHVRALTDNANLTPLRLCALFSIVHLHIWWDGGMGPDVASQTSLEVQPRRSGGPLGREKPFPP